MSTSTLSGPDAIAHDPDEGQDFDPRTYVTAVLSWWKEILLLAFLAAAAAAAGVVLQEQLKAPEYEAVADIINVRLVSQVALDEQTVLTGDENSDANTVNRRREAMDRLVRSGAIAEAVIAELGDQLTVEQRDPNVLLEMVEVESPSTADGRSPSDIIRIHVTADNPNKAAAIANAWSTHYIQLVNSVFGQVPPEIADSVNAEMSAAAEEHDAAQNALEERIAESRVDQIQAEIDQLVAQRVVLQSGRDRMLSTVAEQDHAARLQFFTDLTDAQTQARYRVLRTQSQSQLEGLTRLVADRDLSVRLLDLARILEEQIRGGGDGAVATNQQTLQLLKNQVYTLSDYATITEDAGTYTPLAPSFVYLSDAAAALPSAEGLAADAQALVTALEQRVKDMDVRIEEASQSLLAGEDFQFLDQISAETLATSTVLTSTQAPAVDNLSPNDLSGAIQRSYAELFAIGDMVQSSQLNVPEQNALTDTLDQIDRKIQLLRADLASEEADLLRLTQQRDLAWTAYTALSRKAVELGIEESTATTEVRLGSAAIPPSKPVPAPSLIVTTALAWAVGLLLAIFLALIASYMGYQPIL